MNIVVGTGWCAQKEPRHDTPRAKIFNYDYYLGKFWLEHIENQIRPDCYCVYDSKSDVELDHYEFLKPDIIKRFQPFYSLNYFKENSHRHDYWASIVNAALFALSNRSHLVYIEQDCLVVGLKKAIEFAQDKQIVYGFGENSSFAPGWAACSFVFINNSYLYKFIARIMVAEILSFPKENNTLCEIMFHSMFADDATFWPWGYDRKRPIDYNLPVYYAQQMTVAEFNEMGRLLNLEKICQ